MDLPFPRIQSISLSIKNSIKFDYLKSLLCSQEAWACQDAQLLHRVSLGIFQGSLNVILKGTYEENLISTIFFRTYFRFIAYFI